MDQTIFYPSFRILLYNVSPSVNIYSDGSPTEEGLITYSIIIPIICTFGIIGNTITLIVLSRRELKGSVYVYLAALAFTDLCSSILLFISGLSCGAFFVNSSWPVYDVLLGLPLATLFNTMGVLTTVMVTFDRMCYLSNPLRRKKPRFCHVHVAHRIMIVCFLISVLTTIPYCFIFGANESGEVVTRSFYFSGTYNVYNWIRFIILGILPSIYLVLGNGYLIYALHKVKKIYEKCECIKYKKPQNYMNLTVTLIIIVFIFVISQIPSMLTSRLASTTFFYPTSQSSDTTCNSKTLERSREASCIVTAISLSTDFILYYLFCPPFCKAMKKLFKRKRERKAVQLNVFVLDKQICLDKKSINNLTAGKLFQMADIENNGQCRDSLPSSIYDGSCDRSDDDVAKANRDTLITLCSKVMDE